MAIRWHHPRQTPGWSPAGPWLLIALPDLPALQRLLGPTVQIGFTQVGTTLSDRLLTITVLHNSLLFYTPIPALQTVQNTNRFVSLTVVVNHPLLLSAQPTAFLVLYHIYTQRDGSPLLHTTDGRT